MMHETEFLHEEVITPAGWEFDPVVVAALAISALLYNVGLIRLWQRAGWGRGVTILHASLFAAGWLTLVGALVSPLHEYGEHLFTAHMVEHELLMAVAAPLLALSRPLGTFLHAVPRPWRLILVACAQTRIFAALWEWLNRPLVATVLHGIAIWVWHIPSLLDATIENELMHRLQHASFLVTALFFWWAIIRRPVRESGLGAAHVFATMVHTGLLGALLTLAPRVFYPLQTADAPEFGLTPLEDQQLAGLFMWVPGGAIYLAAGIWLIGRWLSGSGVSRLVLRQVP
jgi:cytochrome c oxidase assembly factor CtaG